MQSEKNRTIEPGKTLADNHAASAALPEGPIVVNAVDRKAPGWALGIGAVFSLATYLFLASLAVFTIFFDGNVVDDGSWIIAPLLMAVAVVPIFGILIFEFAYTRALAGFRYLRGTAARKVQAAAAVVTLLVLTLVHPLLGLSGLISGALGALSLLGLARLREIERFWDFLPAEAVSVLAGRDRTGLFLASQDVREHALAPAMSIAFTALGLILSYGSVSYLTTQRVIDDNAVAAIAFLNTLAVYALLGFARDVFQVSPVIDQRDGKVEVIDAELPEDDSGVFVSGLSSFKSGGQSLLSDVSFSMPPRSILGIDGDSGAGKSLLLSMIADPFQFPDLETRGCVTVNGRNLWMRDGRNGAVPVVHLPPTPLMLPATGAENLGCFHDGQILEHAKRNLERLVFSSETVAEICDARNAAVLAGMQQKTLAMARAFTLSPALYLFDRPEDGLPEKQISAFLARLADEIRVGRTAIVVTQNRAILEACDKILILQEGRVVDFGTADAIRERKATGWARFVAERNVEVEDNLEIWLRSHFKRPGDEPNRRKVAQIASEMLAFSCQGNVPIDGNKSLIFEFKHFVGHCILRMQDSDAPITTSMLQKAEAEIEDPKDGVRLSPLASILSRADTVEAGVDLDRRVLSAKIQTFDPRLKKATGVNAN